MFTDRIKIFIKAGDGGRGCASFFPSDGGPSGGNGGRGGNIVFQGDHNLTSLDKLNMKKIWKAQDGANGGTNRKNGVAGQDLTIRVPMGSEIYFNSQIFYINDEKAIVIKKGGRGGLGNACFSSSTNRAPKNYQPGEKTLEQSVEIVLKLFAHVGIVGMPNSGKSSFLNRVTNARSKVAEYAFSTLYPCLGKRGELLFADVPGLIYGASTNKGLGFRFLSHLEKCKVILILVDISSNPKKSLEIVQGEIKQYGLLQPQVVCFNKCEKLTANQQKSIRNAYPEAFFISVYYSKKSIEKLISYLYKKVIEQKNISPMI